MILVTVGTHTMPFDRLLAALDDPAVVAAAGSQELVVQSGTSAHVCSRARQFAYCPGSELDRLLDRAGLVISHGGIGTLLPALRRGKRVIAFPRLARFGEHHSDHQLEVCAELARQEVLLTSTDTRDLAVLMAVDPTGLRRFDPSSTVAASIRTELLAFRRALAAKARR